MPNPGIAYRSFLAVVAMATCWLLLTGCAPQLDRMEVAILENHNEISRLEVQNQRMMQEVVALGQLLRMDRDAGDESSAMRLAKLSQVSGRLDQLLLKLDDNAEYMRDLSARVDLLATRSGIPTLGEYKPPPAQQEVGEALPEEGRSIFAAAELDRSRGNSELARAGFQEFLDRFGNSEAAPEALYWLGDLAYAEQKHTDAVSLFQDLLERFPVSDRVPAAMFKIRASFLELGRNQEAWTMGSDLLGKFPDSAEAALLRESTTGQ
ncbi:MAG: tetratricopeptide repeat protein [Gemmatimonadales bacterium]|nr:tetratricopeptide repeat protein [Gemmatimonadales bacterium]